MLVITFAACSPLNIVTDTEIAGYPVLKVWMECKEHNDMDIIVQLRKQDKHGKRKTVFFSIANHQVLHHLNYPSLDGVEHGYDQDVNIFKFLGS